MINILSKKTTKKSRNRQAINFDGSYTSKFELALRNFDIFIKEEANRGYHKKFN